MQSVECPALLEHTEQTKLVCLHSDQCCCLCCVSDSDGPCLPFGQPCGLVLQAQELNPQLVKRTRFLKPVKLGAAELWTTVGFCVPAHWLTRDSPGGLTYCSSCCSVSAALQPPHKPPNLTSRWAPTLEWRHTKLNASLNAWSAHMQE